MKIAGYDPSINSTGKCIMTLDDDTYDIQDVRLYGYSKVIKRSITLQNCEIFHVGTQYPKMNMYDRQNIAYEALKKDMEDVVNVSFEGYAYDKNKKTSRSIFQLGEFIGGMKKMFYDMGKGVIIYPPKTVKKFATGTGNADKVTMCKMFEKEFPEWYPTEAFNLLPEFEDPHADLCDAFWMAEILRNHMIYEVFGTERLDEGTVAFLEFKKDKKTSSIVETKLERKSPDSP